MAFHRVTESVQNTIAMSIDVISSMSSNNGHRLTPVVYLASVNHRTKAAKSKNS